MSCCLPIFLALGLWVKDGCRLSFWATSIQIKKEIAVVDGMPELGTQTKILWKDQFVHGLETPFVGIVLSLIVWFFFFKLFQKQV